MISSVVRGVHSSPWSMTLGLTRCRLKCRISAQITASWTRTLLDINTSQARKYIPIQYHYAREYLLIYLFLST